LGAILITNLKEKWEENGCRFVSVFVIVFVIAIRDRTKGGIDVFFHVISKETYQRLSKWFWRQIGD
jgi:hypothetical protein